MKRYVLLLIVTFLIIGNTHIAFGAGGLEGLARPINVSDTNQTYEIDNNVIKQRNIGFEGQGHFFVRRIDYNLGRGIYESSYLIPGDLGQVTYFVDGEKRTQGLEPGLLPQGTILIIDTNKYSMILSQAYSYKDLGRGTKESIGSTRPIEIKKENGYFKVTYRFNRIDGYHGIMWGLGSQDRLIEWTDNNIKIWSNYDTNKNDRLCEDGYYFLSPDTYRPSSPNSYWRNPSMYLPSSLIKTGGSLASDILGRAYLIIAYDNLNEKGYYETLPESQWLKGDFNIGAGFFDTRFNADIGETYLEAYKKFGYEKFRDAYLKISSYYLKHIRENHYVVGGTREGYLVEDYNHRETHLRTHTSLNHQIHAAKLFLKIYELERDPIYEEIGLKLLQGVKNTRDMWIREDSNFHYSYGPSGLMGGVDYPYLTYNDLVLFQEVYQRLYGEKDMDIEVLRATKKVWMDSNNISNYIK